VVLDELAEVHEAGHDQAAATEARERARSLAPSAERDFRLGLLKRDGGDLEGAIALFESAVAADPATSSYRVALAWACENAGRSAEAARHFEEVASREPDYPGLSEELAYNRMRAGTERGGHALVRARDRRCVGAPARLPRREGRAGPDDVPPAARGGQARQRMGRERLPGARLRRPPGVSEGFGGALADSQGGVELAYRPPRIGFRADRVFQAFGRLLGADASRNGSSDSSDYRAGLGLRYKPFGRQNLYLWVERLFGLSEGVRDSWLLRGLFSWDHGYEMRPALSRWRYSYVLADVARFGGDEGRFSTARRGWG